MCQPESGGSALASETLEREALDWFNNLSTVSPQESTRVRDLIGEASAVSVGARPRLDGGYSESSWFEKRSDITAVSKEIARHIAKGHASDQLMKSWRRHVFEEQYGSADAVPESCLTITRELPARKKELLRVRVQVVPSLGPDVAAASFVGPRSTRLVLSEQMLRKVGEKGSVDNLEAEFRIWHHYVHLTQGHLPFERFGWRPEFRRDAHAPDLLPILSDPIYREEEARVNVAATRYMWDEYARSDSPELVPSESVIRAAVRESGPIRWVADQGKRLAGQPALGDEALGPLLRWAFLRTLSAVVRPRPLFNIHVAVVREHWWSPIYLIWTDSGGNSRRRWVPSRATLYALGLRLVDVTSIKGSELDGFAYEGLLIDPEDVAKVKEVLAENARPVTIRSVTAHIVDELIGRPIRWLLRPIGTRVRSWLGRPARSSESDPARLPVDFLQRANSAKKKTVLAAAPISLPTRPQTRHMEIAV